MAMTVLEFTDKKASSNQTQAETLIEIAGAVQLFADPDGKGYATFPVAGHIETWPLRSKGFKEFLLYQFYEREQKPPGSQALQDTIDTLEAYAALTGKTFDVAPRIQGKDGKIYIDLANEKWQAIEVSAEGWEQRSIFPVKFRRGGGLRPLPTPVAGGGIEELRKFVNVESEGDWRLLVGWLIAAMRPSGPYPILMLQGEQGSAKSTTMRILRALVDPNAAPLRTIPREERDLAVAANNSWVLSYDNLSGLKPWLSDAFCRVATGGGFAIRALYTNDEEAIFDYTRPIILNGIDSIASRHDLLDRSLIINLPPIPEDKRRAEDDYWNEFYEARPRILGALLDIISEGLRNVDNVKLDRLPRMADFAKWVVACEPALPWESGGFLEAYAGKLLTSVEEALENDVVAQALMDFATSYTRGRQWTGKAGELLEKINDLVDEETRREKGWPKSPQALGNRIGRANTFLRQVGVIIERGGSGRTRGVRLWTQNPGTPGTRGHETDKANSDKGLQDVPRIPKGVPNKKNAGYIENPHEHRVCTHVPIEPGNNQFNLNDGLTPEQAKYVRLFEEGVIDRDKGG